MVVWNLFDRKVVEIKVALTNAKELIGLGNSTSSKLANLKQARQELSNQIVAIEILIDELEF